MANESQSRTARRKQLQQKQSKRKKNSGSKKPTIKKIIMIMLIVGLVMMIGIGGLFAYYISNAPKIDESQLSDPISSKIYDRNGDLFAELGSQDRTKISYDELPQVMIDAVIATEDARFFEHSGIDFKRILAAIWANITEGFGSEGASTITQQVVKRSFLSPEKTLERKVQEQWLAIKLDQQYSKEEILEMYLNKIYYDAGAYGVAEAAQTYFGISDLSKLTLSQSALLAGLPQRPAAYNPFEHPENAKHRRNVVLNLMVQHNKITEEQAKKAKQVKIEDMLAPKQEETNKYQAFIDKVQKEVEKKLDGANIYKDGLRIYTTLDPKAQEHVEMLLSKESSLSFPDKELETAISVVDTQSGAIRAIGGGRNKAENPASYNYAIQGGRQAGSTFKPIMAYGPAIENMKWSTYHQFNDDGPTKVGKYTIGNYNEQYYGWVTMREALYRSLNGPAIQTIQEVGLEKAAEFASGLGFNTEDVNVVPVDAIGGGQITVNPVQMAGAYAAFGNEGIYNEPYAVKMVKLQNGEELDLTPEPHAAMSEYTAYMITDMLKSVMKNENGTGNSANIPGLPVAGKTGTTNRGEEIAPDSWFTGYTTNYTISVWTGYGEGNARDIPDAGKRIPREAFQSTMSTLSEGEETKDWTKPDTVKEVKVEQGTRPAKLPSEYTPESKVITELFHVDNLPTKQSEVYDQLDPVTDLTAKYNKGKHIIELSWKHKEDVNFEVAVSVNGSEPRSITTMSDKKLEVTQIKPGYDYTFYVTAVGEDSKSETASAQVTVPGGEQEKPEDGEGSGGEGNNGEDDQGQGEGNGQDGGNEGNGNGQDGQGNGNNPPEDGSGSEGGGGEDGSNSGDDEQGGDGAGTGDGGAGGSEDGTGDGTGSGDDTDGNTGGSSDQGDSDQGGQNDDEASTSDTTASSANTKDGQRSSSNGGSSPSGGSDNGSSPSGGSSDKKKTKDKDNLDKKKQSN
ncbi:transglycosylase domain-containing protein [Thalassobacillus pellis]|uniref:transglycosylase domain-containing protein n=1 Tax=Thalassobacillus pellis TaxID=748008 RepID=UPI0019601F27|nr:PBP1A family penicillin-binding protein [Thalassobacillus pellis]MBM7552500.1 penicillin-binding protein 1A [Thalassobacillus pellis]